MDPALTDAFEVNRTRLWRLAYRMLGSVAEADDVVQDAWLRWTRAAAGVDDPTAWLVRAATRLCIDRLRTAKAERDAYRGPWLPEPLVEDLSVDPVERAEDVSVAFLLALERLSPLERAVFLLHDVFDEDYAAVARSLGRTEPAVRQLAARARSHVREAKPRFNVSQEEAGRLAMAFMTAAAQGDYAALAGMLTEDAVLMSDGGGKRTAALRPMSGPAEIIGLLQGLAWRNPWAQSAQIRPARINGYPGVVMVQDDGMTTVAFQPAEGGLIAGIYLMRNPDKLKRLS